MWRARGIKKEKRSERGRKRVQQEARWERKRKSVSDGSRKLSGRETEEQITYCCEAHLCHCYTTHYCLQWKLDLLKGLYGELLTWPKCYRITSLFIYTENLWMVSWILNIHRPVSLLFRSLPQCCTSCFFPPSLMCQVALHPPWRITYLNFLAILLDLAF